MAHTFVKSPFVKIPQIITLSILFPTVTLGDTYALTPPFYLSMTGTKPAAMAFQAFTRLLLIFPYGIFPINPVHI